MPPRSTIAPRRGYYVDSELILQPTGTQSASHTGASQEFNSGATMGFKVVMAHGAFTGTVDGTNNWSMQIEISADNASWTALGDPLVTTSAEASNIEKVYTGLEVDQVLADARYIRAVTTLTGTPGDIAYTGFVTPK